uniref:CFA20 domain-containing protein n=1 Tax=Globisporangium ultimum (strain ATCC 200006 / CBS 805.95 / DAOM BR144) TaxID=431595 RepID=K3WUJ6_GLOUD
MSTSTTTTYFQGGDYVELLSAQGKAPAATWKLQGKILKSFEKTIKGNAFQLEGSTDTKMQLPKTSTTQSLGLSQRFLVFQLLIPFTRSFAIEIGFSDFQKIRRRFVAASAFRETAMTSLHVQIPLGAAQVTRDQWINLVFDLHALTETFFPGSTFRSMESICISGSCKLKRVFTMKDAPYLKPGAGFPVASFADMKEIPKQFVFTSTTNGPGPIPTDRQKQHE